MFCEQEADHQAQLTTNKNRIAFFGHTQKNAHHIFEPGEKRFVAGIYASWAYNETARLVSSFPSTFLAPGTYPT